MEEFANRLSWKNAERWFHSREGKCFLTCLAAAFAWGMIAHAYAFLNPTFSFDSLAVYADEGEETWKIALGRIFVPIYRQLFRGGIASPWLIGVLSAVWIGIACFFVCMMFSASSLPMIALTSGIMTANFTVIAQTGSFLYELDFDMLAVLLAALAAYIWWKNANSKWRYLFGSIPATVVLGIYQSYISVTIVLVMMASMLALLKNKAASKVIVEGIKAIAMILVAGVFYLIALKLFAKFSDVSLYQGNYNSLTNMMDFASASILQRIINAYCMSGLELMLAEPISVLPKTQMMLVNFLFCACAVIAVLGALFSARAKAVNKILFLALCVLLPFGANVANFLNVQIAVQTNGRSHMLMTYAICFVYLLVMLMLRAWIGNLPAGRRGWALWTRNIAALMLAVVLFSNVQVANALYVKKDLERSSTASLMTNVVEDMRETEDYVPGETPVFFANISKRFNETEGFRDISLITGADVAIQFLYPTPIINYFKFILQEPLNYISDADAERISIHPEVQAMPAYPAEGSVAFVDDVLVIKFA